MKNIKKVLLVIIPNILSLYILAESLLNIDWSKAMLPFMTIALLLFLLANFTLQRKGSQTQRLDMLSSGSSLLNLFLVSISITVVLQIVSIVILLPKLTTWNSDSSHILTMWIVSLLLAILCEALIFWNGMLRIYFFSIQLGLKYRILAAICAWIPGLNIYYLRKIIKICMEEVEVETQKLELNIERKERSICSTRYPILMVHGVFFRDFRYLNYWGRIPGELQKNGASIHYGNHQSAATVDACGEELAKRIKAIVDESGCEKVNIIAHSKGGLDSRAAITHFGAAPYVATLTTINTPHYGCIFAERLLNKFPKKALDRVSSTYNATLKRLGDDSPDFTGAVMDLTESSCLARNETTPDSPEVLYESVTSYCHKARSGKFPLNLSYHLVKHFDGKNDGLVSIDSSRWGSNFTLIEPRGKRGVSHGDMIDLNRENIADFDIREFYVSLVASLKNRGY